MIDYDLVEDHIEVLKGTFEYKASELGVTGDELLLLRDKLVSDNGKTELNKIWKKDALGKLALDYYYCFEQLDRLKKKHFLSEAIRTRLYRMVTMNEHIKKIWDTDNSISEDCFLQEQELSKIKAQANAWKQYRKR
jgi:hypothetical protein